MRVCFYVTFKNYLAYNLASSFTKSLMIYFSKNFCFLYGIFQFIFFPATKTCVSVGFILTSLSSSILVAMYRSRYNTNGDFATSECGAFSNCVSGFVDQNTTLITGHLECLTKWISSWKRLSKVPKGVRNTVQIGKWRKKHPKLSWQS